MKTRPQSRPYPVLSTYTDDITPNIYDLAITVTHDSEHYYFRVAVTHNNTTLAGLIREGLATHAIHIECRRNFYREIVRFATDNYSFSISTATLMGAVELSGFALATQPILSLRIDGAHSDYGAAGFDIAEGDVLAIAPTQQVDLSVDYDRLANLTSILTIERAEDTPTGPMFIDLAGERIVATLSQEDFATYTTYKRDPACSALVINQVVIPALFHALNDIRTMDDDTYQEARNNCRWIRSLDMTCQLAGLSLRPHGDDIASLAILQELLKLPLRRNLKAITALAMDTQDEA